MEQIRGTQNLLLTSRFDMCGAEILRVETCDRDVVLPETLRGLPVTALGDHALTPGHREVEGVRIQMTCGPSPVGEWDNADLEAVTLPGSLQTVGDYAFYNCGELRTLRLRDGVRNWGGSVFMNCSRLNTLFLELTDDRARALCYFADELFRELDVTLRYSDGTAARLIFPEYRENYVENAPAHHFDYEISGAGYPYHHCFRDRGFALSEFDALWETLLRTEHDDFCALRMAWYRLRLPRGLGVSAERQYRTYLHAHAEQTLRWLLTEQNSHGLAWFLTAMPPERQALDSACALARSLDESVALALLLESLHRQFPSGAEKTFDL